MRSLSGVGIVLALGLGMTWGQEAAVAPVPLAVSATAVVRAARLTYVEGAVRVERSDSTLEDSPVVNMPLFEGTRLVTGDYGQAEIEFEDGSVVRLTPRSALSLDVLGVADAAARTQMTLLGGMAYFELRKATGYGFRVTAGGETVTPAANAVVRVNLDQTPPTFAVLSGEVRVEHGDGFRATVKAGESLRADAKDDDRYFLKPEITEESWDRWNESRDARAADETDRRTMARDGYAGQQGYGWGDLDAHGTWYDVPGQGQVWQPEVADEGFDPYGYGSWVYSNTGYVFVSGYSWGWTPFRCGRWVFYPGFGWGWVPAGNCGSYGYGGGLDGGYSVIVQGPPRYRKPEPPIVGLGPVHPILRVSGTDGPRPPVVRGGPVRVVGDKKWTRVPVVGGGRPHGGRFIGEALNRDFPVDKKTGKSVIGKEPVEAPALMQMPDRVVGWRAVDTARPVRTPGAAAASTVLTDRANTGGALRLAPVSAPAAGVERAPVVHAAPVRAAPVHSEPIHSEPVRSEPVRTQPVHTEPAHPAPPAPVHVSPAAAPSGPGTPAKPKGN